MMKAVLLMQLMLHAIVLVGTDQMPPAGSEWVIKIIDEDDNEEITLNFIPGESIREFKEAYKKCSPKKDYYGWIMTFNGQELSDEKNLWESRCYDGCSIEARGTMQVFVKDNGETYTFLVTLAHTIDDLIKMIAERREYSIEAIRLVFAGRTQMQCKTLKDFGIYPYAVLHLVPRLPGD